MVRAATILLLFFITLLKTIQVSFCEGNSDVFCIESERQALVSFKQDLRDPSNRLSSWAVEKDCCKWVGVVCHNLTRHVIELHLQNSYLEYYVDFKHVAFERSKFKLSGKINPSLLNLKHLRYLDLSYNDFGGIQIPSFIGSLGSLRYLNFSEAGFGGIIPNQLGNLSSLRGLDLQNSYIDERKLHVENLGWISGLSSLEHLQLRYVNLSKVSDWLQALNMLPSLIELHLHGCGLDRLSSLSHVNFTYLSVLDISDNSFNSSVPKWVFSLSSLISLDLSFNNFFGPIPSGLRNMTGLRDLVLSRNAFKSTIPNWLYSFGRLEFVDLGYNPLQGTISGAIGNLTSVIGLNLPYNHLKGTIPRSLGNLSNLEELWLAGNSISGPISESLGHLSKLEIVNVYDTTLEGVVSEIHLANLTNLKVLILSKSLLDLKVSPDWIPCFQLENLQLRSLQLGPQFPIWLKSQKDISFLDLSHTGISDIIPTWLWNLSSQFELLDLSHNQIHGKIPDIVSLHNFYSMFYLNSNQFKGPLPRISSNVTELDLSNNSFSGNISHFLCDRTNEPMKLQILHLGENLLSEEIPDCWINWQSLVVINLENNNLVGSVPSSMGYLYHLQSLHLRNNKLFGEIPLSIQNCTKLFAVDLGGNNFFGSIPTWMGTSLSNLAVLSLRSNKFKGIIPPQICHLSSLQILDLSENNLSGAIPPCFKSLTAMATKRSSRKRILYTGEGYSFLESAVVVTKGKEFEYNTILTLMASLDLSSNNLSGGIPEELTSLLGLLSLNLSNNHLTGRMPAKIGDMWLLESLDFSRNQLSGEIPPSMSNMTFLDYLNLSYNNLSGKIPLSTQLQSFNASSFVGNNLCGPPLTENCSTNARSPDLGNQEDEESDGSKVEWFYLSMGLGFVVGFWGVFGPVVFNTSWRCSYFWFLDHTWHKLCVSFSKFC